MRGKRAQKSAQAPHDHAHEGQQPDFFASLPDEVLLIVLRQLPLDALLRCGVLGRRWRSLLQRTPSLFRRLSLAGVTAKGKDKGLDNAALARLCARGAAGCGLLSLDLRSSVASLFKGVSPTGIAIALAGSGCLELRTLGCPKKLWWSVALALRLMAGCPTLQRGSLAVNFTGADAHRVPGLLPAGFATSLRVIKFRPPRDAPDTLLVLLDALTAANGGGVVALDLSYSMSGPPIGHALAPLLDTTTSLASLNLNLCFTAFAAGGGMALVRALETNETLTHLEVSYTPFTEAEVTALGAVLRVNSTLRRLRLSSVNVGTNGCVALAAGLAANSTLQELNLDSTKLGAAGVCAIVAALSSTTALTNLGLANNGGGEAGAVALLAALAHNTTLTRVSYYSNGILVDVMRRLKRAANAERVLW